MKTYKRALRRHQKNVKFLRRVNYWINSLTMDHPSNEGIKEKILKGESHTFLKTTGNPCNCYGCSGEYKFVRTQKQYLKLNLE